MPVLFRAVAPPLPSGVATHTRVGSQAKPPAPPPAINPLRAQVGQAFSLPGIYLAHQAPAGKPRQTFP
jgi:hypothetical protein